MQYCFIQRWNENLGIHQGPLRFCNRFSIIGTKSHSN